jgi:hypothetical protein
MTTRIHNRFRYCANCGRGYYETDNYGRFQCRSHPGTVGVNRRYSCCGLQTNWNDRPALIYGTYGNVFPPPDRVAWGCTESDHDMQPDSQTLMFMQSWRPEVKEVRSEALAARFMDEASVATFVSNEFKTSAPAADAIATSVVQNAMQTNVLEPLYYSNFLADQEGWATYNAFRLAIVPILTRIATDPGVFTSYQTRGAKVMIEQAIAKLTGAGNVRTMCTAFAEALQAIHFVESAGSTLGSSVPLLQGAVARALTAPESSPPIRFLLIAVRRRNPTLDPSCLQYAQYLRQKYEEASFA